MKKQENDTASIPRGKVVVSDAMLVLAKQSMETNLEQLTCESPPLVQVVIDDESSRDGGTQFPTIFANPWPSSKAVGNRDPSQSSFVLRDEFQHYGVHF